MKRELRKIDATDKIAGRLASQIAVILQGKNKPEYQPYTDCGDLIEVTNVDKLKFSGRKIEQKVYHRHTGYPGGIRTKALKDMMLNEPQKLFRNMIYNMLPKNKLRSNMIKRLKFIRLTEDSKSKQDKS